jgi:ATP synthase protein I
MAGLLGLAFTSGLTLLAGLFLGYYGGRWLDGLAGTTPWLTLVGLLLGIVAGFRVLLRDILRGSSRPTAQDRCDTSPNDTSPNDMSCNDTSREDEGGKPDLG